MKRQLRMTWFQVRQFVTVPYFVQIMLVTTISVTVVQLLAFRAWGGDAQTMWIRGGIIGVWTTSTSAAGILGFERYKGTLVHLFMAQGSPLLPLASVVSAASTFGMAAIPTAWITWCIGTQSNGITDSRSAASLTTLRIVIGTILLWISCLSVTLVISALFILTPNAIAYEELLIQPMLILSGIFFTQTSSPKWISILGSAFPMRSSAEILMLSQTSTEIIYRSLESILVSALWILAAYYLGKIVLKRVRKTATLEVI